MATAGIQIVVPMSGFGERFRRAGYTVPKPLIPVEGRPILGHVVDLFPGETDFVFVCNADHLATPAYRMREIIAELCPTGRIVAIESHKRGPVFAVAQAFDALDPDRPALVNYCDFTCYWDWEHFRRFVAETGCDGAIPAYRGFHPHSLGSTNYAYMREHDGWVLAIQEKQPYTNDRLQEFASSGTYYFATAALMREAFTATMERNLHVGGEHYVSLAYPPLLEAGRRIAVYPLQHFMQWGTPEDLAEYEAWSRAFRGLIDPRYAPARNMAEPAARSGAGPGPGSRHLTVVPMAGLGERFSRAGYDTPKPLIPVSGEPMVIQAIGDAPSADGHVIVLRSEMPRAEEVARALQQRFPMTEIVRLPEATDGQARTVLRGLEQVAASTSLEDVSITIVPCDSGMLYDHETYQLLWSNPDVDVVIWAVRGYAGAARHPQMYGWIDAEGDRVRGVSVKVPLRDPTRDPVILGAFTFRRAADFQRAADRLIARDGRVRGELYVDSCINDAVALGLHCRLFEVESYLCWGTPADLRTFEYWQSCFHKWAAHPYRLELDRRVAPAALSTLDAAARAWNIPVPGRGAFMAK